jgi:anti-sigma factor RsiW
VNRELTCQELVALVSDYLEGALDDATHAQVERHLRGCPGCAVYLEQFMESIALTGRLREDTVPPALLDELMDAFRSFERPS